jgi:alpha-mannosidase
VTILNDCKHAYDVKDGVIRLTLLRSSYEPDPTPDVGTHHMRYAVLAHDAPFDKAAAVRAAWEFNKPLQVLVTGALVERQKSDPDTGDVGASGGLASLPPNWSGCTVEPANVVLTCLKRAEDDHGFILRAYECAGQTTRATFTLGFDARSAQSTDLLERDTKDAAPLTVEIRTLVAGFRPYEIRTFRVHAP